MNCHDDHVQKVYCCICDKFASEIICQNHLKSKTHLKKIYERKRLKKSTDIHKNTKSS